MSPRRSQPHDHPQLRALGFSDPVLAPPDGRTYVYVIEKGGRVLAAACGAVPVAGDTALLGAVVMPGGLNPVWFRQLVAALVEKAIALGFTYGESEVRADNTPMLRYLKREFDLDPEPCGWEPDTNWTVITGWRFRIVLAAFLAQLRS